ncbi:hemerythrin domain-containing protein [Gorillibacterium sp. sgz5001074]|uniref:hemerythrin domain-containing protein n=1 Tax=Gorillibacterium sp. sgz5001074 TaxID=3446695 RepID=UPI003F67010D
MSRLKGFAAYDSVSPAPALAPALQLLCKEHSKLRKGMEEVWLFAAKTSVRSRSFIEEWLARERKLRHAWSIHIHKEERILLAALSKYVDSDRGPLAVMKYEHERLDALFDEWEEQIAILIQDPSNEEVYQQALAKFRSACQLKADHCYKEEKAIYALAQTLLTEAEKAFLLQQIRKIKS